VNGQLRDHPNMPNDLISTGYEADDGWTRMLEGVDYYTQDYKDQRAGFFRRLESNVRFWMKTRRYLKTLNT
jgi:hypothetical protein